MPYELCTHLHISHPFWVATWFVTIHNLSKSPDRYLRLGRLFLHHCTLAVPLHTLQYPYIPLQYPCSTLIPCLTQPRVGPPVILNLKSILNLQKHSQPTRALRPPAVRTLVPAAYSLIVIANQIIRDVFLLSTQRAVSFVTFKINGLRDKVLWSALICCQARAVAVHLFHIQRLLCLLITRASHASISCTHTPYTKLFSAHTFSVPSLHCTALQHPPTFFSSTSDSCNRSLITISYFKATEVWDSLPGASTRNSSKHIIKIAGDEFS